MGDILINWLQQNQNIAWIASLIIGSGVVAGFIAKYSAKLRKISKIVAHVLDLINGILDAADDKVITKEEVELILSLVKNLEGELK